MPELRWILLILGALFIGALTWWELRRQRQSRRDSHLPGSFPAASDYRHGPRDAHHEPQVSHRDAHRESLRAHHREPTLTLPEVRTREPAHELPLIEIDEEDDSLIGLRIDGRRIEEDVAPEPMSTFEPVVPTIPEPPEELLEDAPTPRRAHVAVAEPTGAEAACAKALPVDLLPPEPIVQWPEEGERRIVALRLVAPANNRFAGYALRQALGAAGFVLGKFSIFHKPGADGRAILSAADLTQPGTFDLTLMDAQRFAGLNLFTVLPGPLPPRELFDELLETARALNERLRGSLQDERRMPLTTASVLALRESLPEEWVESQVHTAREPEPELNSPPESATESEHALHVAGDGVDCQARNSAAGVEDPEPASRPAATTATTPERPAEPNL